MVEDPADYPWSNYGGFIGKGKGLSWLETGWLLSQFGRRKKEARRKYRDFVEGVNIEELESPEKDLTGGIYSWLHRFCEVGKIYISQFSV
jgi:hypothetical protein